jgi:flagellar motor switch protein FliN/FliY
MNAQDALHALATASTKAALDVLRGLLGGDVADTEIEVGPLDRDEVESGVLPAVAVSVAYVNGGHGGNLFEMPLTVARRVAAAMAGGMDLAEEAGGDLTELELSAIGEAMNQMMAAAAAATADLVEEPVEIEAPNVQVLRARGDLSVDFAGATRMTVAVVTLFGEQCRLIQLVPTVFTMRMTQALATGAANAGHDEATTAAVRETLNEVPLRLWAELGRARLRTVEVASLGDGAIVDLDRSAEDPVDIYVNGSRIATGRLISVDETDWAVQLEEVFDTVESPNTKEGAI